MDKVFKESNFVVLFGEGYGGKIQAGGYYRQDSSFVLFDVYCSGWWLERCGVQDIADALGIKTAPLIFQRNEIESGIEYREVWTTQEVLDYVKKRPNSILAERPHESEGIIARSEPVMMFRKGGPIMFKLKCKDM